VYLIRQFIIRVEFNSDGYRMIWTQRLKLEPSESYDTNTIQHNTTLLTLKLEDLRLSVSDYLSLCF